MRTPLLLLLTVTLFLTPTLGAKSFSTEQKASLKEKIHQSKASRRSNLKSAFKKMRTLRQNRAIKRQKLKRIHLQNRQIRHIKINAERIPSKRTIKSFKP